MQPFKPSPRTRIKRLNKRAHYDRETIYRILDQGLLCHVGYVIGGQPYVTPTNYWREGDRLVWHGSSASKMLRSMKAPVPVCVTVSMLDGLVLARSGFHSSVNYRCVMCFGEAAEITDPDEKLRSLEAFVERVTPGRWAELRPVNKQELKATCVIAMTIDEAACKVRTGGPIDDEEDYALDIWAGVVPLRLVAGQPEADARLKPGVATPAYLQDLELEDYADRAVAEAAD